MYATQNNCPSSLFSLLSLLCIFFFLSKYLHPLLQTPLHTRLCCLSTCHRLLLGLSYLPLCVIQFYSFSCLFLSWRGLYKRLYKPNVHSDFLQIFIFSRIGVRAVSLNAFLSCAIRATCFLQSVILEARHCHALVHRFWEKISTFYFLTQLQLVQATASSVQIFSFRNVYCYEKFAIKHVFSDTLWMMAFKNKRWSIGDRCFVILVCFLTEDKS